MWGHLREKTFSSKKEAAAADIMFRVADEASVLYTTGHVGSALSSPLIPPIIVYVTKSDEKEQGPSFLII